MRATGVRLVRTPLFSSHRLFTEMYGFPLTIYLLSGWLSVHYPDVNFFAHDAGHLLETLFGWRTHPHFGPVHLLSYALIGGGFVLLASAWKVPYRSQRSGQLATRGPYACIRHPQYAAFVLVMTGFCCNGQHPDTADVPPPGVDVCAAGTP